MRNVESPLSSPHSPIPDPRSLIPDPRSLSPNPFATRFIRPGALPFVFADEESLAGLLAGLRVNGWWGEIVGPHGSGKSTLLAHLLPAVAEAGKTTELFTLRDGQRWLPQGWRTLSQAAALLAIDGYEQLGRLERWRVQRFCRKSQRGLLVTAHATVGLPTLYRPQPTSAVAQQVIRHLLADRKLSAAPRTMPSDDEVAQLFAQHGGDLRELLFALYDRYEQ